MVNHRAGTRLSVGSFSGPGGGELNTPGLNVICAGFEPDGIENSSRMPIETALGSALPWSGVRSGPLIGLGPRVLGVRRAILPVLPSVNQRSVSSPETMLSGLLLLANNAPVETTPSLTTPT